jgi:uncharacterized protein YcfJ
MKRPHPAPESTPRLARWLDGARGRLSSAVVGFTLLAFLGGCSSQPITVEHELTVAAIGAAVGAAAGAVMGHEIGDSIPLSMFIGAAGIGGAILLIDEVEREAADSNLPPSP